MLELHTQLDLPVCILYSYWISSGEQICEESTTQNQGLGFTNPGILKILPSSLQTCWRFTHCLIRHFAYCIHTEYLVVNAKYVKKAPLEIRVWGLQTQESLNSCRAVYRHVGNDHTAWFALCIVYSIHTEYPVVNSKYVKKAPLEIRV